MKQIAFLRMHYTLHSTKTTNAIKTYFLNCFCFDSYEILTHLLFSFSKIDKCRKTKASSVKQNFIVLFINMQSLKRNKHFF